jgi:hypothetical protein
MDDPENTSYEGEWIESDALTGLSDSRHVMMPYLVDAGASAQDQWVLLIEGDVDGRWQGSQLAHTSGSLDYTFELAEDGVVEVEESVFTPWRIAGECSMMQCARLQVKVLTPILLSASGW